MFELTLWVCVCGICFGWFDSFRFVLCDFDGLIVECALDYSFLVFGFWVFDVWVLGEMCSVFTGWCLICVCGWVFVV